MTTPATPAAPSVQTPVRVPLREAPQLAPIDPASFHDTLTAIKAKPEELKWACIPWQTDLWEARRLAHAANKPIFLWAMNGNPLGCV